MFTRMDLSDHGRRHRERAETLALLESAVDRLIGLGTDTFTLVERAKWFHLDHPFHDKSGVPYRVVSERRCWMLQDCSGLRTDNGRHIPDSPWRHSPILLLEDATIGRFWPEPPLLPLKPGRYVSTVALDPVPKSSFRRNESEQYFDGLKRHLADAVVRYENGFVGPTRERSISEIFRSRDDDHLI